MTELDKYSMNMLNVCDHSEKGTHFIASSTTDHTRIVDKLANITLSSK